MKHKDYLANLTDEQIKQMIADVEVLHFVVGELPKNSLVRELADITSKDYNLPFNITLGENSLMWEVYRRFTSK